MRTISFWAKNNATRAIAFIVVLNLLIYSLALYTGILLTRLELSFSTTALLVPGALFFLIVLIYKKYGTTYCRRKSMDFLLSILTFCSVAMISNTSDRVAFQPVALAANNDFHKSKAGIILESLNHRDKETLTPREKRILKREFKTQIKNLSVAKLKGDDDKASAAIAIIVVIIAAVGLIFLLSGLVCSLACSGSGAAALLIFILGLGGITLLAGMLIRHIEKRRKKKKAARYQTSSVQHPDSSIQHTCKANPQNIRDH